MPHPRSDRATEPQSSSCLLMVRPSRFWANPETSASNAFQRSVTADADELVRRARREFDALVQVLRASDVEVEVIEDLPQPARPDAVFPNNWVSFHADGTAVLYPLLAPSRRAEVRLEILDELERRKRWKPGRRLDLRLGTAEGNFLEGTGSLVLDRAHRVAYACRSPRTSPALLARFARELGYETLAFDAADAHGIAIYHTNVMMSVGTGVAVLCSEVIGDEQQRRAVVERLTSTGHELVELRASQMAEFAGNVLEVRARSGEPLLVLSARARRAYRPEQLSVLERHARLVSADLATIETCGGGSARCMLAEIPSLAE